jgi:hypothetical protein
MYIRLRFRFGVLAAFCVAVALFGSCNVLERTALPEYEARLNRIEGGFAEATVTGHGRTFGTTLHLDLFGRASAQEGSSVTVHCADSPGDGPPTCFAGSRTTGLATTTLFGAASLLAAAWLLRPWLVAVGRRGLAAP